MTILATMPGHFGDILWSLPTVRLLSGRHKTKVDFMVPPAFESILPLIQRQGYILETWTGKGWDLSSMDTAENRVPPECDCDGYEEVYHLGYREWPSCPLAESIRESVGYRAVESIRESVGYRAVDRDARVVADPPLRMKRPWIRAEAYDTNPAKPVIAVGFTNEHIELKMGVLLGLISQLPVDITWKLLLPPEGVHHRAWEWVAGQRAPVEFCETNWEQAATEIASADLFFGCLSAPWVLANAVGTPTVIMEPMEARHNPIFWRDCPKNHLVIGNDEKPTFDLRATRDMIEKVLEEGSHDG